MPTSPIGREETEAWVAQIDHWQRKLEPRFPDIDPDELRMILRSLLQPKTVPRRWLLCKTTDGRYFI